MSISQEHWTGLPFPSLGNLPQLWHPTCISPAWQVGSLSLEPPGKPSKSKQIINLILKLNCDVINMKPRDKNINTQSIVSHEKLLQESDKIKSSSRDLHIIEKLVSQSLKNLFCGTAMTSTLH